MEYAYAFSSIPAAYENTSGSFLTAKYISQKVISSRLMVFHLIRVMPTTILF